MLQPIYLHLIIIIALFGLFVPFYLRHLRHQKNRNDQDCGREYFELKRHINFELKKQVKFGEHRMVYNALCDVHEFWDRWQKKSKLSKQYYRILKKDIVNRLNELQSSK